MGNRQNPIFHLGRQPALLLSSPAGLGSRIFLERRRERERGKLSCQVSFLLPPDRYAGKKCKRETRARQDFLFPSATLDQRRGSQETRGVRRERQDQLDQLKYTSERTGPHCTDRQILAAGCSVQGPDDWGPALSQNCSGPGSAQLRLHLLAPPPNLCLFIDNKRDKLLPSGAINSSLGP